MAQDWNFATPAGMPQPVTPAAVNLRPLSLGEILDRIFTLFRMHFWLFAGLTAIASGISVILQCVQLLVHHYVLTSMGAHAAKNEAQFGPLLTIPFAIPVATIAYAAAMYAIGEVYLGRPISAMVALRATRGRWLRYLGIIAWHGWSAIWVPLLVLVPGFILIAVVKTTFAIGIGVVLVLLGVLGGGVYGAIAFLRNALALPASLMEGLGVRDAMRRSKVLAVGAKGKLFVVLLIFYALLMVAGMIELPMVILIARNPAQEHIVVQAIMLLVSFIANMVSLPVILIGYMLVYFDQRVRKEGFDLLLLMETPAAVPAAVPVVAPDGIVFEEPVRAELALDPADPMGDDGRI